MFKKTDKIDFVCNGQIIKEVKRKGKKNRTCSVIMDIPPHYKFLSKAIFLFDGKTHYVQIAPKQIKRPIVHIQQPVTKNNLQRPNHMKSTHPKNFVQAGNKISQPTNHQTKLKQKPQVKTSINKKEATNTKKHQPIHKAQSTSKPVVHINKPIKRMPMPSPNQKNSFIPVKATVPQVPKSVQKVFQQETNQPTSQKPQSTSNNHKEINSNSLPVAQQLSEIKRGQTMRYKGTIVNNAYSPKLYQMIVPTRTISLYPTLTDAVKQIPIHAKPVTAFTGKILNFYQVKHFPSVFQILWKHKAYFVWTKYVQSAYVQPEELKKHLQGIIPHATILVKQDAQLYNSIHYNASTRIGKVWQGQKENVIGVKPFGNPNEHKTRLLLANDYIMTANKNYVKFL